MGCSTGLGWTRASRSQRTNCRTQKTNEELRGVVAAAGLLAALVGPTAAASDADYELTSTEVAHATDLGLIAKANGWTEAQANAYDRSEREVGRVAVEIAAIQPDVFVGSALSEDPEGIPTIYLKGHADDGARGLVANAAVPIVLQDGLPFSRPELDERVALVQAAAEAAGIASPATRVDFRTGAVTVTVGAREALPDNLELLRKSLGAMEPALIVNVYEGEVFRSEAAFGGMKVLDDGVFLCTSGWTVQRVSGLPQRGVTTAGHCDDINEIRDPAASTYVFPLWVEYEGSWGDIEWHYNNNISVPDDFYAGPSDIRDVVAVEPIAGISLNEYICVYGRGSNVRQCTAKVADTSMSCDNIGHLVEMNAHITVGGDSGGPWSLYNTAYGSHVGACDGGGSVFTPADYFDEAINVRVATT